MNKSIAQVKSLLLLALALTMLASLPALHAAYCYKILNAGLCKTFATFTCTKQCSVNCSCPHDSVINNACYNTFTMTCWAGPSVSHNLGCDSGQDFTSCDTFILENACSYPQTEIVCPGYGACFATLTTVTKAGPRIGVETGSTCDSNGG